MKILFRYYYCRYLWQWVSVWQESHQHMLTPYSCRGPPCPGSRCSGGTSAWRRCLSPSPEWRTSSHPQHGENSNGEEDTPAHGTQLNSCQWLAWNLNHWSQYDFVAPFIFRLFGGYGALLWERQLLKYYKHLPRKEQGNLHDTTWCPTLAVCHQEHCSNKTWWQSFQTQRKMALTATLSPNYQIEESNWGWEAGAGAAFCVKTWPGEFSHTSALTGVGNITETETHHLLWPGVRGVKLLQTASIHRQKSKQTFNHHLKFQIMWNQMKIISLGTSVMAIKTDIATLRSKLRIK